MVTPKTLKKNKERLDKLLEKEYESYADDNRYTSSRTASMFEISEMERIRRQNHSQRPQFKYCLGRRGLYDCDGR